MLREERLVRKKRCMIRNITNPPLASALFPDMFCNKNNAISLEAIKEETTKASTVKALQKPSRKKPLKLQQTAKASNMASTVSPPGAR